MIDFLSKWIEQIALAVIIASIFEMILPKGNLKKYIKVLLGIYIVFSVISPFVDNKTLYSIKIPKEIDDFTSYSEKLTTQDQQINLDKIYVDTLEENIKQTIEKKGYNVSKCTVEGIFDTNRKDAGIKNITIILLSKKTLHEEKEENIIEIEKIEEIRIGKEEKNEEKEDSISGITENDINNLKKYLSSHYEIDEKYFKIEKQ